METCANGFLIGIQIGMSMIVLLHLSENLYLDISHRKYWHKNEITNFSYKTCVTHNYCWIKAKDEELEKAIEAALEAGYRHIDTAYCYENEHVIGKVLKRWLSSGKLKSKFIFPVKLTTAKWLLSGEDIFIVTKLPPKGNRPEGVQKYIKKSLEALQLSYVDVYLIHTPFAFNDVEGEMFPKRTDGYADLDVTTNHVATWKVCSILFIHKRKTVREMVL